MLSLTYLSSATSLMDEHQLTELLAVIRLKNEALGITGVLLYADGNFVQTLEGPDDVVESTFARILVDPRHRGVLVGLRQQLEERQFPDWSMGFRALSPEEARELPGFTDYLDTHRSADGAGRTLTRPEVFHRVFRDGSGYSRP